MLDESRKRARSASPAPASTSATQDDQHNDEQGTPVDVSPTLSTISPPPQPLAISSNPKTDQSILTGAAVSSPTSDVSDDDNDNKRAAARSSESTATPLVLRICQLLAHYGSMTHQEVINILTKDPTYAIVAAPQSYPPFYSSKDRDPSHEYPRPIQQLKQHIQSCLDILLVLNIVSPSLALSTTTPTYSDHHDATTNNPAAAAATATMSQPNTRLVWNGLQTPKLVELKKLRMEANLMRGEVEDKRMRLQELLTQHLQRYNLQLLKQGVRSVSEKEEEDEEEDSKSEEEDEEDEEAEEAEEEEDSKNEEEETKELSREEDENGIRFPLPFVAFTTSQKARVNMTVEKEGSDVRIGMNGHPYHLMDDGDVLSAMGM